MATQWATFPMEFKGGLISNLTPLQQGTNAVGSATLLQNFESDREGGYSKLQGYNKFSATEIPGGDEVLAMKVISSGRAVTARKMDNATITEYQTATSTVNGAVSSATAVSLDNNTATSVVSGAVSNSTTVALDKIRIFTGVTGSSSLAGASATFDVTNTNGTYTATINAAGTGFKVNETVTVVGANLGGATSANNATVTVTSVGSSVATYTNPTQSAYSGSGSSATFNVIKTGTTYTVAITAAGSGYTASETIKVVGTQLNGATTANDATITITTVDGSGGITAATIAGTGLAEGPVTGISIAGTGVSFTGTITKGMLVTGTGISGDVTVKTVTSQSSIILDTAVSLADDVVLSFITNIKVGMFVTGTGISGVVKVATVTNQNSIALNSAQSISDNTVLTFGTFHSSQLNKTLYFHGTGTTWSHVGTSSATNTLKIRHASFNFTQEDKTIFVDSKSFPVIFNSSGNTTVNLTSSNSSDVEGAENVSVFKNHAFYSKGSKIFFTAPTTVDDFATSNGAGTINVGFDVTGMIGFRENLIIFTTNTIKKLTGNTSADFKLEPITDRIGCINPDSIQEFGGDVAYLSPDGIRLLSATDRIGDLALDIASDPIYKDANEFIAQTDKFCSVLVRGKSQYRLFSYVPSVSSSNASGLIATKFVAQGGSGIAWSTTKGLKVNVADSTYTGGTETIMFGNDDGFCYRMDSGNSFDGSPIEAVYESPFMPITDPQVRKTMYKLTLYAVPQGTMNLDLNLKIDFNSQSDPSIIQPATIPITSTGSAVSLFGSSNAKYGTSTYGGVLDQIYKENVIGSFKTISLRITDNSTNPTFTLDTAVLEYRQNDRQ